VQYKLAHVRYTTARA